MQEVVVSSLTLSSLCGLITIATFAIYPKDIPRVRPVIPGSIIDGPEIRVAVLLPNGSKSPGASQEVVLVHRR